VYRIEKKICVMKTRIPAGWPRRAGSSRLSITLIADRIAPPNTAGAIIGSVTRSAACARPAPAATAASSNVWSIDFNDGRIRKRVSGARASVNTKISPNSL